MEFIEESAISTAAPPPRWCYGYVDTCLEKGYVEESVTIWILSTRTYKLPRRLKKTADNRLSFLDTTITRVHGDILVSVPKYWTTHTDMYRYLDDNSHHPAQHKRSVVNKLLNRAQEIPATQAEQSRERKHLIKVFRDNNYPLRLIKLLPAFQVKTTPPTLAQHPLTENVMVLPYVRGVWENLTISTQEQR